MRRRRDARIQNRASFPGDAPGTVVRPERGAALALDLDARVGVAFGGVRQRDGDWHPGRCGEAQDAGVEGLDFRTGSEEGAFHGNRLGRRAIRRPGEQQLQVQVVREGVVGRGVAHRGPVRRGEPRGP